MAIDPRRGPLLFGVLLAIACKDPLPPTGGLIISVTGLPAGAFANVRVFGAGLNNELVTTTKTLDLVPGQIIVKVDTVHSGGALYAGTALWDTITISRGRTATLAAAYRLASGSLALSVTGLPAGMTADMFLTGPTGVQRAVVAPGTVGELTPGAYTLFADTMQSTEGDRFAADIRVRQVDVPASLMPVATNVAYAIGSSTLSVTINGLTGVTVPAVTITGPQNFSERTAASRTFRGLRAGTYTVTAPNVNGACPNIFTASQSPSALQQSAALGGATIDAVTVNYAQRSAPPEWMNLRIDYAYVVQVTQNDAGTVPMLTGRQALLRVFAAANQCNTATPKVRVTLSDGTVYNLDAPESTVRSDVAQGVLLSSWNVLLPAAAIQSGLTFVAEIDPGNAFAELDEVDNRFPATGTKAVLVRAAPTLGLRLVPISQSVLNGRTAVVTQDTLERLMDLSRRIHPVGVYDVDIRETYTTSLPILQSQDDNRSWSGILSEIRTLQGSDQPRTDRYYYGVVKVNYSSGVAGVAYVPGKAGLGWNYIPSGSQVMAHEMGHSFGRSHTPCGGPAGIDPNYPAGGLYAGGFIGVYGYDLPNGIVRDANVYTDIMGYCGSKWISDYTYVGMLDRLSGTSASLPTTATNGIEQPSLLVWGRIVDGVPVLEPAFEISAPPMLPARTGPYRVSAVDASGAELFAYSFAGDRIADVPYEAESFSFVVPLAALRGRTLAGLRLNARGRTVNSVASVDVAADPGMQLARAGARAVRMRWDAARFPVVMVRDPVSGRTLSFARGGDATIVTDREELEMNYSNRIRSVRRLMLAR